MESKSKGEPAPDLEREAFEKWFVANYFVGYRGFRDSMWEAWSARAALKSDSPEPLTDVELREMLPESVSRSDTYGDFWDEDSMFWFARRALATRGVSSA